MFGRKTEEEKAREHAEKMRELEEKGLMYYARYMGGLGRFPLEQHAKIYIYPNRIELDLKTTRIPILYTHMKGIENVDGGKKTSSDRAMAGFLLGGPIGAAVGAALKKKRTNTLIAYTDEEGEQLIAIDLGENARYAQPRIYEHMMRARAETATFPALS